MIAPTADAPRAWPLRLAETAIDSIADLRALAHEGSIVASDLSLGHWRPHHVAYEIFAQLELPWVKSSRQADAAKGMCYADLVGRGIDAEAAGQRPVLEAYALAKHAARELANRHARTIIVLAPRFGNAWGQENRLFLTFLASELRSTAHRIMVCTVGDAMQPGTTAAYALIPGIIEVEIGDRLGFTGSADRAIHLGNGSWLLAPEMRSGVENTLAFDALTAKFSDIPWLRAYGQVRGNAYFVEEEFLREQAWRCFSEGSHGLACTLLERACACSRNAAARDALLMQLHGMRIAVHDFAGILDARDPSPASPSHHRRFLYQARGWAKVMRGEARDGRVDLERAAAIPVPSCCGLEDLYLKNIHALALARTGETAAAIAMEEEICDLNSSLSQRDYRLEYVNSINLARLHRSMGALGEAERWYRRAFSTSEGGRGASDAMYDNSCLARIAAERGDIGESFRAWLRAAFHFSACDVPEALAPRHCAMLIGGRAAPFDLPEAVASALYDALAAAAAAYAIDVGRAVDEADAPAFMARDATVFAEGTLIASQGWSVFAVAGDYRAAVDGLAQRRLRALLHRLVGIVGNVEALPRPGAYIVDDRFGRELASTALEQRTLAVVARSKHTFIDGKERVLKEPELDDLSASLVATIGPLVRELTALSSGVEVRFKRFRPPLRLGAEDAQLILAAREGMRLGRIDAPSRECLRRLERERAIVLRLPAHASGV